MATVTTLHVHTNWAILATYTGKTLAVRVIVLGLDHSVTATTLHVLVMSIAVSAICTEKQLILPAVVTLSGHPMATAITPHVHTNSKVLVTYTGNTSAVLAIVLGLDHIVTATTLHALVTLISVFAICTEKQSMLLTIAPVIGHRMVTVITLHVHITNSEVLATNTGSMSVNLAIVLVLDHHGMLATTLHVLFTSTLVSAIYTENQSVFRTIALVSGHRMATVITLGVHIMNTKLLATDTGNTLVVRATVLALDHHAITATILHALVTRISVSVICTENQ